MISLPGFDLRETRDYPLARNARIGRWLFLGLFVLVLASLLYALTTFFIRGAWSTIDLVFSVLGGLVCCLFLYIAIGYGPQAESVQINEQGLRLTYRGGRVQSIRWDKPRLKLILEQTDPVFGTQRYGRAMWVMFGNRPFQTYLTEHAFNQITGQARQQGLSVEQRPAPRPGWSRLIISNGRATRVPQSRK